MLGKNKYIIAAIAILFFSCRNSEKEKNQATIQGKFVNTKGETIYLSELTLTNLVLIDSVKVNEDGEFNFVLNPKEAGFYTIKDSENNFITLLIDKSEKIELWGDIKQLARTYKVNNSRGSLILWEIEQKKRGIYSQFDSLAAYWDTMMYLKNNIAIRDSLDSLASQIFSKYKNEMNNYILENQGNLAVVVGIYQKIGDRILFSRENDFELFRKVDKSLQKDYSGNLHADDFNKQVSEFLQIQEERKIAESKLQIGMMAPDFKLTDKTGKEFTLSSKTADSQLIIFWKSQNLLSRTEGIKLRELYKKYNSKGFDIIGISLDENYQFWRNVIEIEKLTWTNAIASKQVLIAYNVQDDQRILPRFFLLDSQKLILAKDIRTDELEKILQKLYPR